MSMINKLKVAVLMGGASAEHEVSLASGKEVLKNLNAKRFIGVPVIIPKSSANWSRILTKLQETDCVFIAMHGPYGEDGTVQGMLELAGVKYTGSGVLASALGMNKLMFRKLAEHENITTPKCVDFHRTDKLQKIKRTLGRPPYFVKPNDQGSSVGSSIVKKWSELDSAIKLAQKFSNIVLIDEYVDGVEITAPIIGNDEPVALPLVEIIPKLGDFFDYNSKYLEGGADEIVPARIPGNLVKKVQEIALDVYKLVGCRGFGRVDFILRDSKYPICLEVNTIPGLTPASLFPKSARSAGISYSQLVGKIIDDAIG